MSSPPSLPLHQSPEDADHVTEDWKATKQTNQAVAEMASLLLCGRDCFSLSVEGRLESRVRGWTTWRSLPEPGMRESGLLALDHASLSTWPPSVLSGPYAPALMPPPPSPGAPGPASEPLSGPTCNGTGHRGDGLGLGRGHESPGSLWPCLMSRWGQSRSSQSLGCRARTLLSSSEGVPAPLILVHMHRCFKKVEIHTFVSWLMFSLSVVTQVFPLYLHSLRS